MRGAAEAGDDATGGELPASLHDAVNTAAPSAATSQRFEIMVFPLSMSFESSKSGDRAASCEQLEQFVQPLETGRRRAEPAGLCAEPAARGSRGTRRADGSLGLPGARFERRDGRPVEQTQRVHEELERGLLARRDALLARSRRVSRLQLIRARV